MRMMAVLLVACILLLLFRAAGLRQEAKRPNSACEGRLNQIGLALLMYSADNGGWFPAGFGPRPDNNFEPLNSMGLLPDGEAWSCIYARAPAETAEAGDFIYLGGGLRDNHPMASRLPIAAHSHLTDQGGQWLFLHYADGSRRKYYQTPGRNDGLNGDRLWIGVALWVLALASCLLFRGRRQGEQK